MKPGVKGLVIAVVHVALVASLGAKLLYDRATQPRVWALSAPYDPNLPIRGRYVSLQVVVVPREIPETKPGATPQVRPSVRLTVEGDRLVAYPHPQERGYDPSDLHVQFVARGGATVAILDQPVAFFIPEHIPDPSRRAGDEALWVEVTIPKKGPPRPIRLGVKQGNGPIIPLQLG
jgi:hypothetical protein